MLNENLMLWYFFRLFSPNFTIFFYQETPRFLATTMVFFYCQEKKETKEKVVREMDWYDALLEWITYWLR